MTRLTPAHPLPFNRPDVVGNEYDYIRTAVREMHISGDGRFTRECHRLLATLLGVEKVLLTTSCTAALEMAAILLDLKAGDEVIVPSFTFVSTVNAFVLRGVRPVFSDIRRDTLNLDERTLESLITPRTKAVVPVHYAGIGCEMDSILEICQRHDVAVVEDNAHGLFGKYKGQNLGTFGCLATQSFHETKNITCGEGGALVINDARFGIRAEIIREKGTNRSAFFRGEVDKYSWVDVGSSYLPSDILAGYLLAQLEKWETVQTRRRKVWQGYADRLKAWAAEHDVQLPTVPAHCEQPFHMFYLVLPTAQLRDDLLDHLRREGIQSVFHYLPLHLSVQGRTYGGREGSCPVTEHVSSRLLRLPFFNGLEPDDQDQVATALKSFEF